MIFNSNIMDLGLSNCMKKLLEIKVKYQNEINLIDEALDENILSSLENITTPAVNLII